MSLYEKLLSGEEKLSLVGLGYVGMPIAVAYAKKIKRIKWNGHLSCDAQGNKPSEHFL